MLHDDNLCNQGWESGPAPVLWTDIPKDALVHRLRMFAHIPGGQAVAAGDDPLFVWVRLSARDTCPALPLEAATGFSLVIQKPHLLTSMNTHRNVVPNRENGRHVYPSALSGQQKHDFRHAFTLDGSSLLLVFSGFRLPRHEVGAMIHRDTARLLFG